MIKLSAFFLVTALVAAVMGFGNISNGFDPVIAKVLFVILIILFLLSLFYKRTTSREPLNNKNETDIII